MNFALILLLLSIGTGAIWCYDRFILRRARIASAEKALAAFDGSANHLDEAARAKERELLRLNALRQPAWVEYTGGFFPVIVVVFFLRSFVAEPFRIPSGSMIPTLQRTQSWCATQEMVSPRKPANGSSNGFIASTRRARAQASGGRAAEPASDWR